MLTRMILRGAAASPLVFTSISAAQPSITDLAPRETVLALSIGDFTELREQFERTALSDLLDEPRMKAFMNEYFETGDARPDGERIDPISRLQAAGLDLERIGFPSGAAGFASWFGPSEDGLGVSSHWLAMADFGAGAETVEDALFDLMIDLEDQRRIRVEEEEIGDIVVFTMRWEEDDDEAGAGPQVEPWENPGNPFNDGLMKWMALDRIGPEHPILWARAGDVIALGSDITAMERVIDHAEGLGLESLAASDPYIQSYEALNRPAAYLGVFVAPMLRHAADVAEDGSDPFAGMIPGLSTPELLQALGLDEVRTLGTGLRFDTADAMAELTQFIGAERKEGLLALFLESDGAFDPPAFVDADATGAIAFNFDFSGVPRLVQRVVNAMPEQTRAEAAPMIGATMAAAAPLFQSLAPQVHVVGHVRRPFSPTSESQLLAIRTLDSATISALLAQNGAIIGLERRDFGGNEIWETSAEVGVAAPGIGLGFGYAFIGQVDEVENAMRTADAADAPRLASAARFESATRPLDASGILYSYTDVRTTLQYNEWVDHHLEEVLRAQMSQFLEDPEQEWAEDMIREQLEMAEESRLENRPDADLLLRYIGDMVNEGHATDRGYVFRTLLFSADR